MSLRFPGKCFHSEYPPVRKVNFDRCHASSIIFSSATPHWRSNGTQRSAYTRNNARYTNRYKTNKGKNPALGSIACSVFKKKKLGYVWSTIKAPYTPCTSGCVASIASDARHVSMPRPSIFDIAHASILGQFTTVNFA